MSAETQEQIRRNDAPQPGAENTAERLRPSAEDYSQYQAQNFERRSGELPADGVLNISSIFKDKTALADNAKEGSTANDRLGENKEKPLSSEAQIAKDHFLGDLRERFKDSPDTLKALEKRLDQMDQRVLSERVQKSDGSYIDQQKQLAQAYKNLADISENADKLIYTDRQGNERQVYSQPEQVNNILAGAISRYADPEHNYNQGRNNTCATESINRQEATLMIGEDTKTMADLITKGEFEAVDKNGKTFTCRVDRASMRLDREAQQLRLGGENARDAYGQIGDLRTAQLNLDLISRSEQNAAGREGGEGRYVYKKVSPISQRDTGERVVDTERGKVIANSPCINGEAASAVKQSLFGRYIDKNFGKETTLVSAEAFGDTPNVTAVRNGAQLKAQVRNLEAKGWKMPMIATHVGNYLSNARGLSGAEGWHATSVKSGDKGLDFINNWGGQSDYKNVDAERMFSWMKAPANASAADRRPGDHIFNPDGILVKDGDNPFAAKQAKTEDLYKHDEKITEKKDEEETRRQLAYASQKLAEIEGKISSLAENDPERKALIQQKQNYESAINKLI